MVVQTSESVDDGGPRVASEVPATITPDLPNDCTENGVIQTLSLPKEESPEVKRATDKIVQNAVSIDVIVPAGSEDGDKKFCEGPEPEKKVSFAEDEKRKRENVFMRYFRKKTKGMSKTQIAILCIFPFVEFFAATVISIQGPFYPQVAREKGATPSEYGLVFGSFEIIVFIMAPIYGAKMGTLNPHRLFNYGIFTTSLTCILFGFVHHINDRVGFILVSLIIRVIEAIGDAAFVTASFSIIAVEFPDTVATTFAMMETFYGLGMIAGPTVGGALFGAGGFTLPFAVMGGLLFISAIATYKYITSVSTVDANKIVAGSSFDMFRMLKIPTIALTAFGAVAAATGIGFLSNNLEHHLSQFNLSEFQVGCIFMLNGGVYALSAPLWGRLCDKSSQLKVFSLIGALLTIVGFSLVGPLPFFPSWNTSIPVICIGLVIFGFGLGSTLVSAFVQFLHDALANGHPDDVSTHGLVSGLWTSMVALGFFIGPTCGGFLDHAVGFRWGTLFILLEQLILVLLLLYFFHKIRKTPSPEEKDTSEDNLDDIVITYALKMNTPKPAPRKKNSSRRRQQAKEEEECTVKTNGISICDKPVAVTTHAEEAAIPVSTTEVGSLEILEDKRDNKEHEPATDPKLCESSPAQSTNKVDLPDNEKLCPSSSADDQSSKEGQENPSFVGEP